ncbi:DUF6479 family protein [Streptomyces sp. ICBB 8177]|uniref:DUF6479 family protein n=1 Tax=Streptomyces sp. ICBB 8177 TaxID=563922 RepID=UPI000D679736|nr:DUF6479 family protein [Streptomyces sp. ICBB 8177]PWI41664.1 hypothetical protein CK485_22730 [Streptomyces sp. ICBB 8177]
MKALSVNLAAQDLDGIWPMLVFGGLAVIILIGAVVLGLRRREPPVPKEPQLRAGAWHTRQEYGEQTPPDHGPGHQDSLPHGPQEPPQPPPEVARGHRRRPHEFRDHA